MGFLYANSWKCYLLKHETCLFVIYINLHQLKIELCQFMSGDSQDDGPNVQKQEDQLRHTHP